MNKKNDQQEVDHSGIIASEITKTIIDYCVKSGPVNMAYIVKALSDVMGAHLASMIHDLKEIPEDDVIRTIFSQTLSTMKECKKELDEDVKPINK